MSLQLLAVTPATFVEGSGSRLKPEFDKANANFTELYGILAGASRVRSGVATLVGGTVVVADTAITASSRIFLTCQTPGGTAGFLGISTRTASTSFTILSSSGTDTSVVGYLIVEPSA